jgi:hypothetical protein
LFPSFPRGTDPEIHQPVQGVHVDFTPDYARVVAANAGRVINDLSLHQRRWQIISAWRPLFGPLYDWPLGVLDYTSINCALDLIASDNVYHHQVTETYNVFFNQSHRWFYLSQHQPNEILLFKAFDSLRRPDVARVCPHAAFYNPLAPPNSRLRESIECLNLVLYPKGTAEEPSNKQLPSETPSDLPPVGAFQLP